MTFPLDLSSQAVVAPQSLPKIFSSKEDATLALSIVLENTQTLPPIQRAERMNVIGMFCFPDSQAAQEVDMQMTALFNQTQSPLATFGTGV